MPPHVPKLTVRVRFPSPAPHEGPGQYSCRPGPSSLVTYPRARRARYVPDRSPGRCAHSAPQRSAGPAPEQRADRSAQPGWSCDPSGPWGQRGWRPSGMPACSRCARSSWKWKADRPTWATLTVQFEDCWKFERRNTPPLAPVGPQTRLCPHPTAPMCQRLPRRGLGAAIATSNSTGAIASYLAAHGLAHSVDVIRFGCAQCHSLGRRLRWRLTKRHLSCPGGRHTCGGVR